MLPSDELDDSDSDSSSTSLGGEEELVLTSSVKPESEVSSSSEPDEEVSEDALVRAKAFE